jgi:hypothetical protein
MPSTNWPARTNHGPGATTQSAEPAARIAMSTKNARLRPIRSAAMPPTAAPKTAPKTRAEPMKPSIVGAIAKSRLSSGSAMPSDTTEKPSSNVPPLANSQYK